MARYGTITVPLRWKATWDQDGTGCGLSLTEAKQAIDEGGAWPGRAEMEAELLDPKCLEELDGWDPASGPD